MSRRERIAAFEAWLVARGEGALFNRSIVDGLLSVTGGDKLDATHVDKAVALARDAGMDTAVVAALGALVLEHEGEPPAEEPLTLAEPAPVTIKLRVLEPAASPTAPDAPAPLPADPVDFGEPADGAPTARPKRCRGWIGYAAGVAAVAALVLVGVRLRSHRDEAPRAAASKPRATVRARLHRVPLTAAVPPGWREATDAELLPAPAAPASLVFRGGSAADPEHGVYVAVLPGTPAGDADAALIAAASTAERGLGAVVARAAGRYQSAGCSVVVRDGVRIGACVGTAQGVGPRSQIATYVRVIGDRQVVAVSIAHAPSASASTEDTALVASLAR